ncbi:MAG: aldehyde dehydrogenase [Rhodocyclaceae bacterium]|nr:aldehyde dehydrogenase [Rhodocyclaceae bacterium]
MSAIKDAGGVRPFLIGKDWSLGGGKCFESICPIDGTVAATIAEADADDVDAAVACARAALNDPRWAGLRAHQRARLLHRLADLLERDAEQLAQIQTRDNGKTIFESRLQVMGAAETFRYYGAVCEVAESEVMVPRGNYFSFSTYEPIGVVAAITPWNSPLTQESVKLAPALAAGNTVILKPSEVTPQIGLEFGRLALEAGFPPGVLNVLSGTGRSVGSALVAHPDIDMVTFTGGTTSGRLIGKIAAERPIPVMLELGGKSPNIIFDDMDLDRAVQGALYGIFPNAGQSCIAGSRIFVHDKIYDAFLPRLVEAVASLRVGDPYDPLTAVAPVGSFEHRDRIEAYIERARQEGAKLLCGGQRPGGPLAKGAYVMPTLLEVADNNATVAQEEIFGPVACLLRFKDEDDLVRQANDTVFGLACGIWTRDYKRALRVAGRLKAGTVWINTYRTIMINMPFGGYKASGIGRECGVNGMRAYQAQKSVYMDLSETPIPWPPKA